jgi:hypothetical protein
MGRPVFAESARENVLFPRPGHAGHHDAASDGAARRAAPCSQDQPVRSGAAQRPHARSLRCADAVGLAAENNSVAGGHDRQS